MSNTTSDDVIDLTDGANYSDKEVDIYAITMAKGGIGKSTTTRLLGQIYASRGERILLFDVDPQGSLVTTFDVQAKYDADQAWADYGGGITDAILNSQPEAIARDHVIISDNLHLVQGGNVLDKLNMALASIDVAESQERLVDALSHLHDQYGYDRILIDMPAGGYSNLSKLALNICDWGIMPCGPDHADAEGIRTCLRRAKEWGSQIEWIITFLTKYHPGSPKEQANAHQRIRQWLVSDGQDNQHLFAPYNSIRHCPGILNKAIAAKMPLHDYVEAINSDNPPEHIAGDGPLEKSAMPLVQELDDLADEIDARVTIKKRHRDRSATGTAS